MTQEQLDQECLEMLPLIAKEIMKAGARAMLMREEKFPESIENMRNIALIEATNSPKKLVNMTKTELSDFQHCLIKMFKYHGWTK